MGGKQPGAGVCSKKAMNKTAAGGEGESRAKVPPINEDQCFGKSTSPGDMTVSDAVQCLHEAVCIYSTTVLLCCLHVFTQAN